MIPWSMDPQWSQKVGVRYVNTSHLCIATAACRCKDKNIRTLCHQPDDNGFASSNQLLCLHRPQSCARESATFSVTWPNSFLAMDVLTHISRRHRERRIETRRRVTIFSAMEMGFVYARDSFLCLRFFFMFFQFRGRSFFEV